MDSDLLVVGAGTAGTFAARRGVEHYVFPPLAGSVFDAMWP